MLALEPGANHVIDPRAETLTEAVHAITPAGVDYAFDTTGVEEVLTALVSLPGVRGALAMSGVPTRSDIAVRMPLPCLTYKDGRRS